MSTFECCICLEVIKNGENTVTTKCKHTFCLTCLLQHYEEKNNCPLCRGKLVPEDNNEKKFKIKFNMSQISSVYDPHSAIEYQLERILLPQVIDMFNTIREEIEFMRNQTPQVVVSDNRNVHVPRQRRRPRCSLCLETGHNRRRCPTRENVIL